MVTIFLCDDDKDIVAKYRELIKQFSVKNNTEIHLRSFNRAEELLFELDTQSNQPDIIFLDIYMDKLNGMEAAKRLRDQGITSVIIFLTTSSDFVFDAFDVGTFNYLLKQEVDEERFTDVLSKAIESVDNRLVESFECSFGSNTRRIPYRDIQYFEIYKRVIRVHFNGSEYFDFYGTMDKLAETLEGRDFIRIHRSFLINMAYITVYKNHTMRLNSQRDLPIGRAYLENVKRSFNEYTEKKWST